MKTTDLSDQFETELQTAEPGFLDFGGNAQFSGPIVTVEAPDDNSKVREQLERAGLGQVLVVEGHASKRCALLGDLLAELAVKNGWAGVVVNGYVRDSARLGELPLGVKALGAYPRKSEKKGRGSVGETLRFAGVEFVSGHMLYADEDGIVVSSQPLTLSPTA